MNVQLSDHEATTRQLIEADRKKDDGKGNWVCRQIIRQVFYAMWTSSLPISRIKRIGEAISTVTLNDDEIWSKELSAMVRRKILRSRMCQGVRFYEVNY